MEEEIRKVKYNCNCNATGGAVYGLAFVGAAIYYLQHSATFLEGLIGILKALVWPAILLYKLVGFLGL